MFFRNARHLILVGTLGSAVGVPYLMSESGDLKQRVAGFFNGGAEDDQNPYGLAPDGSYQSIYQPPPGLSTQGPLGPMELAVEGPPVASLEEVFRFDVAMDWLLTRWPRVTTQLVETNLQGYRVPLVTGVRQDDLAGSLTYYFDEAQIVRKITFEGTTGDATRLVQLVTRQFELERESDHDPGLFAYRDGWNGEIVSELRVRPSAVVRADDPHRRFHVSLTLRNPDKSFFSMNLF